MNIRTRILLPAIATLLTFSLSGASASTPDHPAPKRKFDIPPSAELLYSIKAKQSGFALAGNATLKWNVTDKTYSVWMETRAMLIGRIIESKSEGVIDAYGLAPTEFTEKRIRKNPSATTFNRDTKTISFTQTAEAYPIKGGEQDRTSIIWQLISVARAAPNKFKAGSEWDFFVAGQRDAEAWTFKVVNQEVISSALGEIPAVHLVRAPRPGDQGQQLNIWLAPSLEWYPLRLHFTDHDGNTIEQRLESISKM